MKKLIATLALILSTLVGGAVALAPSASAEECQFGSCTPAPTCEPFTPCAPAPTCEPFKPCAFGVSAEELAVAEQTANDYRAQVVALTSQLEHVQQVAARRAATIQRLRAKIRALR